MDYIETFKNLKTNNKWGRKSPHKAVLMLTVIEMYEKNILSNNEIPYNEILKSTFMKVWNRVLPNEHLYHPEVYMPFWYLQSDRFWHIVPIRGKEDVLSLMHDNNIKPLESRLVDSVKYAELDEDLYFLMTIASGRSTLKRILLENYTKLSEEQINTMAESADNTVDHSLSAMNDYEQILSSEHNEKNVYDDESSTELKRQFNELSDDLQVALSYEYFAFLKKNRSERDVFREVCPNVYTLYDCIFKHPLKRTDISPSFTYIYDNFLYDLKIGLMSENGSVDLIDKIDAAIVILRGNTNDGETEGSIDVISVEQNKVATIDDEEDVKINNSGVDYERLDTNYNTDKTVTTPSSNDLTEIKKEIEIRRGKTWTHEEEERITEYFERGISVADIAERVGRTEVAIKVRLAKLGLIEYTYGQDESDATTHKVVPVNLDDYQIENGFTKSHILNKQGERVFTTDGKLKSIGGKIYRLNLKNECFTIKDIKFNGRVWVKGDKKIVAYPRTELYKIMDYAYDYSKTVEDLFDGPSFEVCKLKANGIWYNYQGDLITDFSMHDNSSEESTKQHHDYLKISNHPQYAVRKQAILRAMGYFRFPAKIRDIARTISRTAWGAPIKEDDVEEIISTLREVEKVDEGKFLLKKRR